MLTDGREGSVYKVGTMTHFDSEGIRVQGLHTS